MPVIGNPTILAKPSRRQSSRSCSSGCWHRLYVYNCGRDACSFPTSSPARIGCASSVGIDRSIQLPSWPQRGRMTKPGASAPKGAPPRVDQPHSLHPNGVRYLCLLHHAKNAQHHRFRPITRSSSSTGEAAVSRPVGAHRVPQHQPRAAGLCPCPGLCNPAPLGRSWRHRGAAPCHPAGWLPPIHPHHPLCAPAPSRPCVKNIVMPLFVRRVRNSHPPHDALPP